MWLAPGFRDGPCLPALEPATSWWATPSAGSVVYLLRRRRPRTLLAAGIALALGDRAWCSWLPPEPCCRCRTSRRRRSPGDRGGDGSSPGRLNSMPRLPPTAGGWSEQQPHPGGAFARRPTLRAFCLLLRHLVQRRPDVDRDGALSSWGVLSAERSDDRFYVSGSASWAGFLAGCAAHRPSASGGTSPAAGAWERSMFFGTQFNSSGAAVPMALGYLGLVMLAVRRRHPAGPAGAAGGGGPDGLHQLPAPDRRSAPRSSTATGSAFSQASSATNSF